MAFSLSGSVITQSGTDTSLSGLSTIAGVTRTVLDGNTSSAESVYTLYSCPYRLVITGNLTIDPEKELFSTSYKPLTTSDGGIVRIDAGTLTIGVDKGLETTFRKSRGLGLIISSGVNGAGGNAQSGRIVIINGGVLNLYAGIRLPNYGEIYCLTNGYMNIKDGEIFSATSTTRINTIRLNSVGSVVDGLKTNCAFILSTNSFTLKGLESLGGDRAIVGYGSSINARIDNYVKSLSTSWDIEFIDTAKVNSYNSPNGTDLRVRTWWNLNAPVRTAGLVKAIQEVSFKIMNTSGDIIDGAKCYVKDVDNGYRVGLNGYTAQLSDIVYNFTSGADGLTESNEIVLGVWNKGTTGDIPIDVDLRFNSDDIVPFKFIAYGYNQFTDNIQCRVADGLYKEVRLIADGLITEPVKSVVEGYTSLDNPYQVYDFAKSYLIDNYKGETDVLITRISNTLVSTKNIIIDSNAGAVCMCDGTTITIKSSVFTGNITTTGTITLLNGATVSGTIIDSTADSTLSFAGVSNWKVYNNSNDRDANTNLVASGTSSENYRFNFVASTVYYLRLEVGNEVIFKNYEPLTVGENIVDLTTAGLLTALPFKIDETIGNQLDGIDLPSVVRNEIETTTILAKKEDLIILNNNVKKASMLIPANENI